MSGMLVEDLTADERSSRFLFPSARIRYVWNGDCSIGLGPWWTRMGRTLQPLIQILIDMWHEWEINHCCLKPLRFGGLFVTTAYPGLYWPIQWEAVLQLLRVSLGFKCLPFAGMGVQTSFYCSLLWVLRIKQALNHKRNSSIILRDGNNYDYTILKRDCYERSHLLVNINS